MMISALSSACSAKGPSDQNEALKHFFMLPRDSEGSFDEGEALLMSLQSAFG